MDWVEFQLVRGPLLGVVLVAAGCGAGGGYELHWTLGCAQGNDACVVESTRDCTRVGVDAVEVLSQPAAGAVSSERVVFACFVSPDGGVGHSPGLGSGSYELQVYALDGAGRRTSDVPVIANAEVPTDGAVVVQVDLPLLSACSDGVDNDADGYVDAFDPDCVDPADLDEGR